MSKILERQASTKRGLRARRTGVTMDHKVGMMHPCPRPLLRMALWTILCCFLPSGQSFSPSCLSSATYPPAERKPFQSCGRRSTTSSSSSSSSSTSILSSLPDDNDADTQSNNNNNNNNNNNGIRFLGRGPHAIIRPGVVLIAPPDEFHHFYRQSAIFIYAMGEDETYNQTYVVRGAIIDHPTPFTLDEMVDTDQVNLNLPTQEESPGNTNSQKNPLSENLIYRGGDRGEDSLFLLHNQPSVGSGSMIGTSGIFQGGLQDALTACRDGKAAPDDFKFYFNYCEFTEDQLEQMLADDPWMSAEIPSHMILNAEWDRGDCWKQLRNALRDHHPQQDV